MANAEGVKKMPRSVEIKMYSTLVYVPTRNLIQHYFGLVTIQEYRDHIRNLMYSEKNLITKNDYERCLLVLEKAIDYGAEFNCNANLCMNNAGLGIKFHFDFDNIDKLLNFKKAIELLVSGTIV